MACNSEQGCDVSMHVPAAANRQLLQLVCPHCCCTWDSEFQLTLWQRCSTSIKDIRAGALSAAVAVEELLWCLPVAGQLAVAVALQPCSVLADNALHAP